MFKAIVLFLSFACANQAFGTAIYDFSGTFSAGAADTELITPSAPFSAQISIPEPTAASNRSADQTIINVGLTYVLDGLALTTYPPASPSGPSAESR